MRLDHLLSKEHHETQTGPTACGITAFLGDSLDGLFSVVEAGLVHNKQALGRPYGTCSLSIMLGCLAARHTIGL